MPNLRIRDTFAGGNGHELNVLAGGRYSYSNLDDPHSDKPRNIPSLTKSLNAIAVLDRIPGEWWRDGAIAVEGFMLSDGSYCMSQTQAAEIVGLSERNARDFLSSKAFKSLRGEGYTPAIFDIDENSLGRGQSRFNALDLDVVITYWTWQCFRGSKQALTLLIGLATESLERRFDAAFEVERSEQDHDDRLASNMQQMENYLKAATDYEAEARFETQYYRDWLTQRGFDPDNLPAINDEE